MKILIYGAGSVGSYYGARMARGGAEVTLLCRGSHFDAVNTHGLTIIDADGKWQPKNVSFANTIAPDLKADVIILCVKLYDLIEAAQVCRPALAPDGIVVPIQNGVESVAMIGELFKREQIAAGSVLTNLSIDSPGVVKHLGQNRVIKIESNHNHSDALLKLCNAGGLEAELVTDVDQMLWRKFCRLATNSGISCLTRRPIAAVRDLPVVRNVMIQAIAESVAVGRAFGVNLESGIESDILSGLDELPAASKSSMLLDLEAGKQLELHWLSGAVDRLAQKHHIATPIHSTIYAALLPFAEGAGGQYSAQSDYA